MIGSSGVVAGGRYCTVASTCASSVCAQPLQRRSAASWTARPAISVRREAEALPAFGARALSSVIISTARTAIPSASAAIWRSARCAALPDIRRADPHDRAARPPPGRSSTVAVDCSGKPERIADVLDPAGDADAATSDGPRNAATAPSCREPESVPPELPSPFAPSSTQRSNTGSALTPGGSDVAGSARCSPSR